MGLISVTAPTFANLETMRDQPAPGYSRDFLHKNGRTLVRCECRYCGFEIVGSAPEIVEEEWVHRDQCSKADPMGRTRSADPAKKRRP